MLNILASGKRSQHSNVHYIWGLILWVTALPATSDWLPVQRTPSTTLNLPRTFCKGQTQIRALNQLTMRLPTTSLQTSSRSTRDTPWLQCYFLGSWLSLYISFTGDIALRKPLPTRLTKHPHQHLRQWHQRLLPLFFFPSNNPSIYNSLQLTLGISSTDSQQYAERASPSFLPSSADKKIV